MANVVFVATSFTGHLNPTFGLARELRERGHEVAYVGTERVRAAVLRQGFRFEPAPFVAALTPAAAPAEGESWPAWWRRLRRTGAALKPAVAEVPRAVDALVERLRPDLLVFDPFLLRYYVAFHAHGVPAVVLSTNPLLEPDPCVPPYTCGVVPAQTLRSRTRVRLAWARAWTTFAGGVLKAQCVRALTGYSPGRVSRLLARQAGFPLRRQRRLRPWIHDYSLRCVPELVLDAAEFDFPRGRPLPAGIRYAGPCVDLDRIEPAFDWGAVPDGRALVLCSVGTVRQGRDAAAVEFLRNVVRAVAPDPSLVLILVTGDAAVSRAVGEVPRHVVVREAVPQLEVLARADAMITHGGFNSVKECVAVGVPMLVYPLRADQPGNAARVVYHGLGIRGDHRRDGSVEIGRKLAALLGDGRYRARVEEMRACFRQYREDRSGAAAIAELLGTAAPEGTGRGLPAAALSVTG